jgi:hypothetical protein
MTSVPSIGQSSASALFSFRLLTENGLGNALVLDLGRMLKSAVADGGQQLRLEQKLAKSGGVHGTESISFGAQRRATRLTQQEQQQTISETRVMTNTEPRAAQCGKQSHKTQKHKTKSNKQSTTDADRRCPGIILHFPILHSPPKSSISPTQNPPPSPHHFKHTPNLLACSFLFLFPRQRSHFLFLMAESRRFPAVSERTQKKKQKRRKSQPDCVVLE